MSGFNIVFWNWWALATVLIIIEMLVPGFFFLGMAVAGIATGMLLLIAPVLSADTQFLLFSVMSIFAIVLWRKYGMGLQSASASPLLNKRGEQYIGRVFNLCNPIVNGEGHIKADDSIWKVYCRADCANETPVKVLAVHGTGFDVVPID